MEIHSTCIATSNSNSLLLVDITNPSQSFRSLSPSVSLESSGSPGNRWGLPADLGDKALPSASSIERGVAHLGLGQGRLIRTREARTKRQIREGRGPAWLTEIHEYAQRDVVIMLLGNKSHRPPAEGRQWLLLQADVSNERVIRSEDGETLAREYGVPFMETSAKTGMNVELAFLAIAKELKHRALWQPDGPHFQIRDFVESQKKQPSCCSFL
ncbi:ras-related protein Rab-37 isoform X5 [Mustela lutreola]|uniref:ras-related protein Rab-37 isoform X5 n=1 Tax=Mustela lutreola TaxID=9666 RepID=UPI0027971F20|nr:ras-related protein Rab-37 isoform X5 [Mustela lutreola]